jgi:hypothetical protein
MQRLVPSADATSKWVSSAIFRTFVGVKFGIFSIFLQIEGTLAIDTFHA